MLLLQAETLQVKNGQVDSIQSVESAGVGVRVLVRDGRGFASSHSIASDEIDHITGLTLAITRASSP